MTPAASTKSLPLPDPRHAGRPALHAVSIAFINYGLTVTLRIARAYLVTTPGFIEAVGVLLTRCRRFAPVY
jgi:hypothetical protein